MKLITLRDWAEYYYSMGLSVYSSNAIRSKLPCYFFPIRSIVDSFDWEGSEWIGGIAGADKLTVITFTFNLEEVNFDYVFTVVSRFLYLVDVYNYPWVIWQGDQISVLLHCHFQNNQGRQDFGAFTIIWTGFYRLPFIVDRLSTTTRFYFGSIPIEYPKIIKCDVLWSALEKLIDEFGLFLNKNKEDTSK